MKLMLDTNMLVRICHPTDHRDVQEWLRALLLRGTAAPELLVSVIADYELRSVLVRRGAHASLAQLDNVARSITYVPVTAEAGRRAAEISASLGPEERRRISDADILIAAQAQAEGAVLVTSDLALHHVPGLVAKDWKDIELEE